MFLQGMDEVLMEKRKVHRSVAEAMRKEQSVTQA